MKLIQIFEKSEKRDRLEKKRRRKSGKS